jgi:hypothetical protein
MKWSLLIVICFGLVACQGVTPEEIAQAEYFCAAHGGLDTINHTGINISAFDATCKDGVEFSYAKYRRLEH